MSKAALNMNSALTHNKISKFGGQVLVVHPGHVKSYMSGNFNEKGDLTAKESAEHILKLVFNHEKYKGDKPAYVDYLGRSLEW